MNKIKADADQTHECDKINSLSWAANPYIFVYLYPFRQRVVQRKSF